MEIETNSKHSVATLWYFIRLLLEIEPELVKVIKELSGYKPDITHLIKHLKNDKNNLIKGKVKTWTGYSGTLITSDGYKFYFQASGTAVAPNSILPGLVVVFYGIQKKPFPWQKNTLPIAFGVYSYKTKMEHTHNFLIQEFEP